MSQNATKIIGRLKEELSLSADKDVCEVLGIKSNTLSTWKKRDTLDFNKVIGLCDEMNLDLNYIFFNERQKPVDETVIELSAIDEPITKAEGINSQIETLDEFKLINTNRNLAVFLCVKSEHPSVEKNSLIIGQRVTLKNVKSDTLYISKNENNEIIVDELVLPKADKENLNYKFHSSIEVNDEPISISCLWQVISIFQNT